MKKITEVLSYKNQILIQIIMQKMGVTEKKAKAALIDTLKFLWLCANSTRLLAPPKAIDEVWHLFILSTESYKDFCENYLGCFIHHRPAVNGIIPGINEDLEILHYNTMIEAKKLHDSLGEKLSENFTSGVSITDWCCHGSSTVSSPEIVEEEGVNA